jgi:uncharacterized membrane protein YfcA
MEIYLPIAHLPVSLFAILGIGGAVGFLSGMLGVSGGFLATPLLIFYGIPADISVATQASPIAAASLVGAIRQGSRNSVDYKMGLALLAGGTIGSGFGVFLFGVLQRMGQIDFVIQASYILLLGGIGALMLNESARAIRARRRGTPPPGHKPGQHTWIHNLPFKMRFRQSRLYISVIPIIMLGAMVGVMTAILGTGGAFILIPAKIYILRMRTTLAVGTSQFQMFMVACITTVLHSVTDHTVDAILGFMLVVGGVVGAHYGSKLGTKLRGEELRAALALLILVIAIRIAIGLLLPPDNIYSIQTALPQHFG